MVNRMHTYNPFVEPNKEEWLAASEVDRVDAVRQFHRSAHDNQFDDEALSIHCAIHVIVESQLAIDLKPLPSTVAKLIRQGLDRHEVIHAIGAILSEDIFSIIRGEKSDFSLALYRHRLEKVTAKRWKKGQY